MRIRSCPVNALITTSVSDTIIPMNIDPRLLCSDQTTWIENFPFTRMTELPEGEKQPPQFKGILNVENTSQVYGDGVLASRTRQKTT